MNLHRMFLASALASSAFPLAAQTVYHSPNGLFDLEVPAGWQVDSGKDSADEVTVRNGASTATVGVFTAFKKDPQTAKSLLDEEQADLKKQCPTYQTRKEGPATLAGAPGQYLLSTCSDARSPAVAECTMVATADGKVIELNLISPLAKYYENIPVFDGIRDSIHVRGRQAATAASASTADSEKMMRIDKACAVGLFTQEECGRKIGMLMGEEEQGAGPAASDGPDGKTTADMREVYRDPQGRFSLRVPKGWTATAEGNNGAAGVQLRSGSSWINIMPVADAASASEVVLRQEEKVAAQSQSGRKPPFGKLGLIQIFGHGLEVTYDQFDGSTPQGGAIHSSIAGIGDIKGGSRHFLLMISSIGGDQADSAGSEIIQVAQSVQFPEK